MNPRTLGAALAVLASLSAGLAHADTRRYAAIVANTTDAEGKLAPLEYADDDGARYYELFSQIADEVELYTVLDADSQRLYPEAARRARIPKRRQVLDGLHDLFARAARDVARGDSVVFYFILVGHGKVGAGGEGYVSLLDAPFTRTDLFHEVLAKSPATTNHVIVDACNSYYLVHRRGGKGTGDDAGPSRREAIRRFLAKEDLSRYPNTGVLLSTSSEKETHEWSAYGAGVFSHQVRSALAGAADVNGDGAIEYSEIEAFLAAANLRVADPRARLQVYGRAPAVDLSRPLVDLREAHFSHWLRIPKGHPMRVYLEDARGVRYLDAHLSGERPVVLGLVPSPHYYLREVGGAREARLDLGKKSRIDYRPGMMKHKAVAARGAVSESFRLHLYEEPFGPGFYRGFVASEGLRAVDSRPRAWLPGKLDAGYLDAELSRLNVAARQDPSLRRRLDRAAPALLRALEVGHYRRAASLLRKVEARR